MHVRTVDHLAAAAGGRLVTPTPDTHRVVITDVTHDSRKADPSTVFVAIRGQQYDGHNFVPEAIAAGSPAVCVDHEMGSLVIEIVVDDTRAALGPMAADVYDNPSQSLPVVGVTGTNGKTTVTHQIEALAGSAGRQAGLIGTIETRIGGHSLESARTTPEASDFQRLLARMRDEGMDLVAAEVSSHALELGRVAATRFAVAAFTSFSQDHLDFHHDMEAYRASKESLFTQFEVGTAVVNIDDPVGGRIAESFAGRLIGVGRGGEVRTAVESRDLGSTVFTISTPWGEATVESPVIGDFNVTNAALAATCCLVLGMGFDDVIAGLGRLPIVPGRFELISGSSDVRVIVDYAHTPDGIEKAVSTARSLSGGQVIAVFGAGGDRDREKRPEMGRAASLADSVVVTSDNPRSESPARIIDQVLEGIDEDVPTVTEPDRRRGIRKAIETAEDGDIVLVLGRGHEPFQEVDGERRPFDDREVARQELAAVRKSAESVPDSGSMDS